MVQGKAKDFWSQYDKKSKWVLASTAVLLLFIIIFLTMYFTKTEYEIAYQNLDNADAAAVIDYLESNGISYKLNGTSISVPSASVSKVKVDVGSQGLVQSGSVGFAEMSQSSSIGTTDKEFSVKYRNMYNGEIQQLLLNMQGISKVKAIVTLPEATVFLNDSNKDKATAAVVITFQTGFRPKQTDIDSYYNLVKSAVPNLAIEDIRISSSVTGDLTPSAQLGGQSGISGELYATQFAIQEEFDNKLRRNIQSFLSPLVGMDNIVVSVVSALNFDKKTSQENIVQPLPNNDNRGIEISREESTKTYTGAGSSSGPVGVGETDIANYPSGSGSGGSTSEEASSITNWEISRIINNIDYGPYKVKDLSINVGVDAAVMTDELKQGIQDSLFSSVRVLLAESGLELTDEALTQRVSVMSRTFQSEDTSSGGVSTSTIVFSGLGLLAIALLAVVGYVMYRRKKAAQEAEELAAATKVELPTIDIDNVANESQVRKQLESLAKRKPDEFVNLLRTWLVDE